MLRWRRLIFLFAASILYSLFPVAAYGSGKPNVILITMESTRADRMGFLGSKAKLTPNLDNIARESLVFEQAYSQAPLRWCRTPRFFPGLILRQIVPANSEAASAGPSIPS